MKVSVTSLGPEFPKFLTEAVSFLDKHDCVHVEGVFRVSGLKKVMDAWVNEVNQSMPIPSCEADIRSWRGGLWRFLNFHPQCHGANQNVAP